MAGSILPDLQLATWDLLDGHPTMPAGVKVTWGPPPEPQPEEFVAVGFGDGMARESTREWRTLGSTSPHAVEEEFTLRILVEAVRASGDDLRAPDERAGVIADAVETILGSDLTLTSTVWHSLTVARREQLFRTDQRRGGRVFLTLAGMARRTVT